MKLVSERILAELLQILTESFSDATTLYGKPEVFFTAEDGVSISNNLAELFQILGLKSLLCSYSIPEVAVPVEDGVFIGKDLAELLQILSYGDRSE
jgi:hypothetical protein